MSEIQMKKPKESEIYWIFSRLILSKKEIWLEKIAERIIVVFS